MAKKTRIRPIALGLIEYQNHVFVSQGQDKLTGRSFYRFLGGGIEFGETSEAALRREFSEEIQAQLSEVHYLTCLDNLFTYQGKPKHELIQLFRCQFADQRFYQLSDTFRLIEGNEVSKAFWVSTARLTETDCPLVPSSCLQYLS